MLAAKRPLMSARSGVIDGGRRIKVQVVSTNEAATVEEASKAVSKEASTVDCDNYFRPISDRLITSIPVIHVG